MKTWLDLIKGDPLYLLVPIKDETGYVTYQIQKTKVINTHIHYGIENHKYTSIRFKYTDSEGYRRRRECLIYYYNIDNPFIIVGEYPQSKLESAWGNIIMCFDKDNLKPTITGLINIKQKEINELVNTFNKNICDLNNIDYNSI